MMNLLTKRFIQPNPMLGEMNRLRRENSALQLKVEHLEQVLAIKRMARSESAPPCKLNSEKIIPLDDFYLSDDESFVFPFFLKEVVKLKEENRVLELKIQCLSCALRREGRKSVKKFMTYKPSSSLDSKRPSKDKRVILDDFASSDEEPDEVIFSKAEEESSEAISKAFDFHKVAPRGVSSWSIALAAYVSNVILFPPRG